MLRDVLARDEIDAIAAEIDDTFERYPAERGREDKDEFRYEMLNRGAASQAAIGHDRILEVIEPLLGNDCHVIANTAWRNPPDFGGGPWHCDAGPQVPRPEGVEWDDRIPYPVFAIGAHLMLKDCPVSCGPTAVIPGSLAAGASRPSTGSPTPTSPMTAAPPCSSRPTPATRALFVSDVWHRGTPASGGDGRLFLQCHYGRHDIAQRIRTTADVNHLSPEAIERAQTQRQGDLVGLHNPYFYDG